MMQREKNSELSKLLELEPVSLVTRKVDSDGLENSLPNMHSCPTP